MNKKKAFFGGLAFVLLLLLVTTSVLAFGFLEDLSLQRAKTAIDSLGAMATVVFFVMCVIRGLVFLPCGMFSVLGGMIFGPLLGTILTLFGLTVGSVCTFYLARSLGKGWAQRVLGHKYNKYDGYITKDSFYRIFLMRVVPILPFDAVSCIAGMSRAKVDRYILATLIGSFPGVFIYVYFGDSVRSLSIRRIIFSFAFIAVFVVMPFCYKYLMKIKQKTA